MAKVHNFNVFLGGQPGVFMGCHLNRTATIMKHHQNLNLLSNEDEITAMSWGDFEQNDILIGTKSQQVKIFNTDFTSFSSSISSQVGSGPIVGISKYNELLLTAVKSGQVKIWNKDEESNNPSIFETKKSMDRMRHFNFNSTFIATGGKDNDLRIWDLEQQTSIFQAKNVPKDMLQLEVPIWVSDIAFLGDHNKVAISSRHGHIRLYDCKAQKRPVINHHIEDERFICISTTYKDHYVLTGSGTGRVYGIDFRNPKRPFTTYKGPVGSVRSIACHPNKPFAVVTGLDRFLRLYDLEKKCVLFKEYAKFQFNCVLIRNDFSLDDNNNKEKRKGDKNSFYIIENKEDSKMTKHKNGKDKNSTNEKEDIKDQEEEDDDDEEANDDGDDDDDDEKGGGDDEQDQEENDGGDSEDEGEEGDDDDEEEDDDDDDDDDDENEEGDGGGAGDGRDKEDDDDEEEDDDDDDEEEEEDEDDEEEEEEQKPPPVKKKKT